MYKRQVVSYAKSLTKYKNEIYDFLDIIMVWYRDMLILKTTGSLNQLVFKDKYRQLKDQEIYICLLYTSRWETEKV